MQYLARLKIALSILAHVPKSLLDPALGQEKLSVVPSHPYLGIEIDNKLSWKQQIEKTKQKSIRTLNMVRRNFTKGTTSQIRNQIFTGLVRPTLEYGCIVWDPHQMSRIQLQESVQNKGARYVMQDWDRHTSVSQMKLLLGWCTLQERRLVNRLSFFHKSVHKYHRLELPPYVMKPQGISKNPHSNSFQNIRAQSDQLFNICTHSCLAPFFSKGSANSLNICLLEDENVVNDPVSVCNIFNNHFSNIANDIGRDLSEEEVQNHTSVNKIREHVPIGSVPFVFKPILERQVDKYITSIGKKKATGLDDLSAKVLKIIKQPYLCHLTRLINRMFEDSTFPKYIYEKC